jgi:hypothetical protein
MCVLPAEWRLPGFFEVGDVGIYNNGCGVRDLQLRFGGHLADSCEGEF